MKKNFTSPDSVARSSQRDQWRTSLIALLITLILHWILLLVWPSVFFMKPSTSDSAQEETIELTLEPADPETLRYVEVNPEAPENEPDRSNNYSFRSQQAADENPNASQNEMPTVEGDEASQKIVQGSANPTESTPFEIGAYTLSGKAADSRDTGPDSTQASTSPPPLPTPLPPSPSFIQQKPEVDEGPGSSLKISGSEKQLSEDYSDTNIPLQLYRTNAKNQQEQNSNDASNSTANAEAKPLPRKRLTLPPDLIHGPLMRSKGSASRRGALAIDATFSQFGEYEQQFYAAVQAGWYQEIDFFQPIDTSARVVVQFRIRSDGTIDDVKILHSTASEIATLICQTALTKRSPFRPWTAEMIKVFGQERVMEVAFSYR